MRNLVTQAVDARLREIFKTNQTVLNFLLKHERKPLLIERLTGQIWAMRGRLDRAKLDLLIRDFTKQFATAAIQYCDEQNFSEAEKQRRIWAADNLKRAEAHIKDLEEECLHENKEEGWAAAEIQARVLRDADPAHE